MRSQKIGREHPFNQARITDRQREHRANGHVAQWFGQDIVRLRQRLLAGDVTVTAEMIEQTTREQLANLKDNANGNPELAHAISQFLYSSAFRLLRSLDRVDPATQHFLDDLGFTRNGTVIDSNVRRLGATLGDFDAAPVETYLDMFQLRREVMQAKVAEHAAELESLREEFIAELPIVVREARLPITVEAAIDRIRSLNLLVSDPFVYATLFRNMKVTGHFNFSAHTAHIDFERLEEGGAAAKKTFTHEAYHALSGETLLLVSDDDDRNSAKVQQQRLGLKLGNQYGWFNEAVTELSTRAHYMALDRYEEYKPYRTYTNEVYIVQMLLEKGAIPSDRLWWFVLQAYYENIDSTKPNERMQYWRNMSQQFRAAYGAPVLQAVNKYMVAGRPERAMNFITNPGRADIAVVEAEARRLRDQNSFRAELKETGNAALAMLSEQRPAEFHTLARGVGAAKASQYTRLAAVPPYHKHLVAQILEKTKQQSQQLQAVLEEQLQTYERELVQPQANEDTLHDLLHLALLTDSLPDSSARARVLSILRKWSEVFRNPDVEAETWFQDIVSPYLILPKAHVLFELLRPEPEEE